RRFIWQPLEEKENQEGGNPMTGENPTSPDQYLSAEEMSRRVAVTLKKLPPNQRTAFILRNHEGLSIREIAEVMRSAEGTIKVHLHRAVMALRRNLAEFV
ncbi:MAG: RNA polymerase sigma factor, partial [Candidatus Binatia bacterium]